MRASWIMSPSLYPFGQAGANRNPAPDRAAIPRLGAGSKVGEEGFGGEARFGEGGVPVAGTGNAEGDEDQAALSVATSDTEGDDGEDPVDIGGEDEVDEDLLDE